MTRGIKLEWFLNSKDLPLTSGSGSRPRKRPRHGERVKLRLSPDFAIKTGRKYFRTDSGDACLAVLFLGELAVGMAKAARNQSNSVTFGGRPQN